MMFIDSGSTNAPFNFALEKYVMESLNVSDEYFMFWRTEPTLMTGRFQNTLSEINMQYAREHGINIVRRVSGGGTIYTDPNGWQFSFIVKGKGRMDFAVFTKPIIEALRSIGIDAELTGRNDLTIQGRKFSGNAQYIGKNVMLHHGSILFDTDLEALVRSLNVDDEKIISKGIKSVRQRVTNISEHLKTKMTSLEFRDLMLDYLLRGADRYELNKNDIEAVNEIKRTKFNSWDWNYGNDPKFNVERENRFPGGKLSVKSFIENGVISDISFYGDFFADERIESVKETLIGCRYNEDDIKDALKNALADECFYNITIDQILSCII